MSNEWTALGRSRPEWPDELFNLLTQLLELNHTKRITAADALAHPFFLLTPQVPLPPSLPASSLRVPIHISVQKGARKRSIAVDVNLRPVAVPEPAPSALDMMCRTECAPSVTDLMRLNHVLTVHAPDKTLSKARAKGKFKTKGNSPAVASTTDSRKTDAVSGCFTMPHHPDGGDDFGRVPGERYSIDNPTPTLHLFPTHSKLTLPAWRLHRRKITGNVDSTDTRLDVALAPWLHYCGPHGLSDADGIELMHQHASDTVQPMLAAGVHFF